MSCRVIYSSPFIPPEWIAAHGMQPSRVMPRSTSASSAISSTGVCPYARAFMGMVASGSDASAVIVTTECDQMRRAFDAIKAKSEISVFQFNLPHTWQSPAAHRLYSSELQRLGRFLMRLGGNEPVPDDLRRIMLKYDAARDALRAIRCFVSAREYSELLSRFQRDGETADKPLGDVKVPVGVSLALVGGPLLADHSPVFDLVEKAGGHIDLDATETGERCMPESFDKRRVREDPFQTLIDAYFSIPDAFRRPNSSLYQWLKWKFAEREIRGIIYRRYIWCDTWHAEAERLKEWAKLPFIHLDVSDDAAETHRTLSRLQSFMEMLS